MVKCFVVVVALTCIATALAAQSPPPPPAPTETTQKKQEAGDRVNTNGNLIKQVTVLLKKQNEAAERQRQKDREKSSSDWWIVYFTGALTFVGIVQLIAMFRQASYMREGLAETKVAADAAKKSANAAEDSVVLARQNMHLDQRAWVAPNEVITKRGSNQPLTATILLKNTGKTFAKRCFVSSNRTVKALTDADPDFDTLMQTAKKINLGIIAPSQQVPYTISATFQSNDPDAVRLIFGKVTYTDVFNYDHWTTFCYRILESSFWGSPVERYTSYNNAH
jgi:hypothetical protein